MRREEEDAKKSKEQIEAYITADTPHQVGEVSSRTDILLKEFIEAAKRTRISLIAISISY